MKLARIVVVMLVALAGAVGAGVSVPAGAQTEPTLEIWIEKHAQLGPFGGMTFRVHVVCGPLPGSHDFREGHAGGSQARTGAAGEGGLSPDAACDGTERIYIAQISSITDAPFRPGPAAASAAVTACNILENGQQVCVHNAAHREVVIRGGRKT